MTDITRETIDAALAQEQWNTALAQLRTFFESAPSLMTAQFTLDRVAKIPARTNPVACRMAFLRSFTLEPAVPLLRAAASLYGVDITAQVGDFNTYAQDILNPASNLYSFDPHIVVLAAQNRDALPDLWNGYADLSPADAESLVQRAAQDFAAWVSAFRSRSQASLILHNLELPPVPRAGLLDAQNPSGQTEAILTFNRELKRIASEHTGVYVLDYDGLVARHGRLRWRDERKWLTARMPIAADCLPFLAKEYLRFVLPLMGKGCKALVMDLDNTLWGGVIGEDGMNGIRLGAEYPGAAFLALQRVALDLYQRGILLAINSKNNSADAMEALEQHPAMLLRPSHFAALRINWNDKAQNLREIAAELNIGIDSLAFIDDNPVERERVRQEVPEVTVIDLPEDPMGYADALRDSPVFERLTLSAEDRERGRYYAEQRQRVELEQSAGSLEDFYRSLEMMVEIAPVSAETLVRTVQLTQKTNQFNMTTRRYSEAQIEEKAQDSAWRIYTVRARDRFGDNGLVGVALTRTQGAVCEIDTFLLSCRVIGRTVETAILSALAEDARKAGARCLRGWFLPTKKNAPSKEVYCSHGFLPVEENESGALWELDLNEKTIACPEWIELRAGT